MTRWTESHRPYDWANLVEVHGNTLPEAIANYRQGEKLPSLNAADLLVIIDRLDSKSVEWFDDEAGHYTFGLRAQTIINEAGTIPPTMRRSGRQIGTAIGVVLVLLVIACGVAAVAGANDLDCRPVITGPYADYDGIAAVTLTVPDYCPADQQVRLVVFSLPADVTALTAEAADTDQTPTVIVDATLQPGVPNTIDPGHLSGCGDLQIDVAPNNADWAALQVGVVAPHNLPGAITASAEHADDQCHLCTFAVPVPDFPRSVEEHDDAPCGADSTADSAPGGQTGPDSKGVPVLSAATSDVTSPTPQADVASSEAETTAPPLTAVSASAAPTNAAAYVELPNTGGPGDLLIKLGVFLALVGALLLVIGPDLHRKEKRP